MKMNARWYLVMGCLVVWGLLLVISGSTFTNTSEQETKELNTQKEVERTDIVESDFQDLEWRKSMRGVTEFDIKAMALGPQGQVVYIGTDQALYQANIESLDFKPIQTYHGSSSGINDIYISNNHNIYVATNQGLHLINAEQTSWSKIFSTSIEGGFNALSVIEDNQSIYLGTSKGLYVKKADAMDWHKVNGPFRYEPIYALDSNRDQIFIVNGHSLYSLSKADGRIDQLFSVGISISEQKDIYGRYIKDVQLMGDEQADVVLATTKGIFVKFQGSKEWQSSEVGHAALKDVQNLIVLKQQCDTKQFDCLNLLIGSTRGAFSYIGGRWTAVFKGMETNNVRRLEKDANDQVYAATDKGVYVLSQRETLPLLVQEENEGMSGSMMMSMTEQIIDEPSSVFKIARGASQAAFGERSMLKQGTSSQTARGTLSENRLSGISVNDEPTIKQVHQWAIDYAEVDQDKIKDWRKKARQKAWYPKFSLGVDSSRDWARSDSLWGSSSNGGTHYVGPDDKTFGSDFGWDISMTWDLADTVWSTDQTTIDSRSKLMVELREDIIDQVTRIYFERKRIQYELVRRVDADEIEGFDRSMRVEELTALLDGYTGGRFSEGANGGGTKNCHSRESGNLLHREIDPHLRGDDNY